MDLKLTDAEQKLILSMREKAQKIEYAAHGIFLAADYLERLGNESAGGEGKVTNPATRLPWGNDYYHKAGLLRAYAANLQSDWKQRI